VTYNLSLLRGESVLVQTFDANSSHWGVSDSSAFMVCFSSSGGSDCLSDDEQHLGIWAPRRATAGNDGISAVLTIPSPPSTGSTLSAVRYGWTLSNQGDTCCPQLNATLGYEVRIPANCPIKSSRTFLPGNPFYANITALGTCACLFPQVCNLSTYETSSSSTSESQSVSPSSVTCTLSISLSQSQAASFSTSLTGTASSLHTPSASASHLRTQSSYLLAVSIASAHTKSIYIADRHKFAVCCCIINGICRWFTYFELLDESHT